LAGRLPVKRDLFFRELNKLRSVLLTFGMLPIMEQLLGLLDAVQQTLEAEAEGEGTTDRSADEETRRLPAMMVRDAVVQCRAGVSLVIGIKDTFKVAPKLEEPTAAETAIEAANPANSASAAAMAPPPSWSMPNAPPPPPLAGSEPVAATRGASGRDGHQPRVKVEQNYGYGGGGGGGGVGVEEDPRAEGTSHVRLNKRSLKTSKPWLHACKATAQYQQRHKGADPPDGLMVHLDGSDPDAKKFNLGRWCADQRDQFANGRVFESDLGEIWKPWKGLPIDLIDEDDAPKAAAKRRRAEKRQAGRSGSDSVGTDGGGGGEAADHGQTAKRIKREASARASPAPTDTGKRRRGRPKKLDSAVGARPNPEPWGEGEWSGRAAMQTAGHGGIGGRNRSSSSSMASDGDGGGGGGTALASLEPRAGERTKPVSLAARAKALGAPPLAPAAAAPQLSYTPAGGWKMEDSSWEEDRVGAREGEHTHEEVEDAPIMRKKPPLLRATHSLPPAGRVVHKGEEGNAAADDDDDTSEGGWDEEEEDEPVDESPLVRRTAPSAAATPAAAAVNDTDDGGWDEEEDDEPAILLRTAAGSKRAASIATDDWSDGDEAEGWEEEGTGSALPSAHAPLPRAAKAAAVAADGDDWVDEAQRQAVRPSAAADRSRLLATVGLSWHVDHGDDRYECTVVESVRGQHVVVRYRADNATERISWSAWTKRAHSIK
jgi:hypothetical protein